MKFRTSLVGVVVAVATVASAESINIPESFWRAPAQYERFSTLTARWDNNKLDVDFALDAPLAGGFGMAIDKNGASGQGIITSEPGGYLHFIGNSNLNPDAATVRFMARGRFWAQGQIMTLFAMRRETFSIEIVKKPAALALIVRKFQYRPGSQKEKEKGDYWRTLSEVSIPLSDNVDPEKWHSVVASWDVKAGGGLIALDGAGETGKLTFPNDDRGVLMLLLGGSAHTKYARDAYSIKGTAFDELQCYNQPLEKLLAWGKNPPPPPALVKAETGARNYFRTLAKLQRYGGWQGVYSWPTLIGCDAQGRYLASYDDIISNDKTRGSALIAAWLIYGYEIFNDHYYLDLARKTADFYVAAQSEEGAWNYSYKIAVNHVTHNEHLEYKFQDSVQSHPIYLLSYIYRITGEKKYHESLMRAGAFYLKAQNPDGSWSHHYDVKAQCGRTAGGLPNGGEINDLAMNDAIDVMTLMWHFTKDRRYIDAMKRAGDWLLKARLRGAVDGWAQQYDNQIRPVWAREFEPPAMSFSATDDACKALAQLYRLSGDKRFRDPIVECRDWFAKKFPDGMMSSYYEIETGRPIRVFERKIYHLDDPKEAAAYASFFQGVPARSYRVPDFQGILESAVYPVREKPLDKEGAETMLGLTQSQGKMAADTQNEAGVWVYPNYGDTIASIGAGFIPGQGRAFMLLRYIDAARTARGELPLAYRGGSYPHGIGSMKNLAFPSGWYDDVPWNK
ncbi:pectate lyase [Opitutaceae bacterium TAV4]|nr:pectate lyase [Opitutaceae bacterium TAV4]RRK00007.1 pectate lyase [Opitutaceae bacterium TAV3]